MKAYPWKSQPFLTVFASVLVSLTLYACGSSDAPGSSGSAGTAGSSGSAGAAGSSGSAGSSGGGGIAGSAGGNPLDGGPDGSSTTGNLTGRWEGTVEVAGLKHLKTGTFPAVLHLVHRDDRVRGVLDVNQDAGFMAEWFGYYLEGTLSGDTLSLELTDRSCGAGDPPNLCAPRWGMSKEKVFEADLQVGDGTLSAAACDAKAGITYPEDVPIEAPFITLNLSLAGDEIQPDPVPFAGKWKGPFNPPFSVIYAGLRMFGTNEITFEGTEEGGFSLTRFDHEEINIYPTHNDIILAESFHYDASSKRFWFVEAGSVYGTWLWIGEVMGDTVAGHFISDPTDQPPIWEDTAPVDPFSVPFENFEATFLLKKQ